MRLKYEPASEPLTHYTFHRVSREEAPGGGTALATERTEPAVVQVEQAAAPYMPPHAVVTPTPSEPSPTGIPRS